MKVGIYLEISMSYEPPEKVAANIDSFHDAVATMMLGYVAGPEDTQIYSTSVEWYRIDDGPMNYRGKPPS